MKSPTLFRINLSLLFLTLLNAGAQTADDFFHSGAQSFLSNNIPGALTVVTNGLQRFPEDEKLKKLYELLNQQQQQQQQQNEDQKAQQEQKDEQKQDQQEQDQQTKNDQEKQDEQKKPQEAKDNQEQEKKDPHQAKSGDESKDKPEDQAGQQPAAPQAMTPQEAKQLLDAQKDDEQVLIFQPQGEPKNRTKQLKDW